MTEQIIMFGNQQHLEDLSKWVEKEMKKICDKIDAEMKAEVTREKVIKLLNSVIDEQTKAHHEEYGCSYKESENNICGQLHDLLSDFKGE